MLILPAALYMITKLLCGSIYKEFATLDETITQFSIGVFERTFSSFGVDEFGNPYLLEADSYVLMFLLWIMKNLTVAFFILLVAYFSYTYRKAAKYEKNMAPASQSSTFFSKKLNEIQESLDTIQAR